MFTIGSPPSQIFLATGATDLRRGFNGLYTMIAHELGGQPLSGALYGFCNKNRTMVKLFVFDRGGVWVCAKRRESGTFSWPAAHTRQVTMTAVELEMLLTGMEFRVMPVARPSWEPGPSVSGVTGGTAPASVPPLAAR